MNTENAPLSTISLARLLGEDETERQNLLSACKTFGFFYLSFEAEEDSLFKWDWPSVDALLFDHGPQFFGKPIEDKLAVSWDKTGSYFGYKPRGGAVVDKEGTPDSNEFLNISKEDALRYNCKEHITRDLVSLEMASSLRTFVDQAHTACLILLRALSKVLEVHPSDRLEDKHGIQGQSGDHLRLIQYGCDGESKQKSNVMLLPHTDFGSLTLLFTNNPGLQVVDPLTQSWKFVAPSSRKSIVNVGDTLFKLTNGLLRSCQHRVIALPSDAADPTTPKVSLGYFLRPEDHVVLKTVRSSIIPQPAKEEESILSKDWIKFRANASKSVTYKQEMDWSKLRGTAENWVESS